MVIIGTPNYPKDLASEWNQLKRDVKKNFTSANMRTGMAKIGARVIEVTGSLALNAGANLIARYQDNKIAFQVGTYSLNGDPDNLAQGFYFRRPDGSLAIHTYGKEDGSGFLSILDKTGHIIFSDDAISGKGLARPWIPYTTVRTAEIITPTDKVTTGTWTAVHTVHGVSQHPKLELGGVLISTGGGDTGQVRLRDPTSGEVLWTSAISSSTWVSAVVNHVAYEFDQEFKYDFEVRRATGTGTGMGFTPTYVMGRQT